MLFCWRWVLWRCITSNILSPLFNLLSRSATPPGRTEVTKIPGLLGRYGASEPPRILKPRPARRIQRHFFILEMRGSNTHASRLWWNQTVAWCKEIKDTIGFRIFQRMDSNLLIINFSYPDSDTRISDSKIWIWVKICLDSTKIYLYIWIPGFHLIYGFRTFGFHIPYLQIPDFEIKFGRIALQRAKTGKYDNHTNYCIKTAIELANSTRLMV